MQAWFNQKYISVPDQATVSQISPNFCFFETFALRRGRVDAPEFHEQRIFSGLNHLSLDKNQLQLNFSDKINHWGPVLKNLFASEKLTDAIIRWIVIPNKDGTLSECVTVRPLPLTPPVIDLFLLKTPRDSAEWLPRLKTGPWKNSQEALDELKKLSPRMDIEGIQFDARGNVSDGTRSTLVWWNGSQWSTPSQETQCLKSTTLETLRKSISPTQDITYVEQPFPLNAQSMIMLRSTFEGGAVLINKVLNTNSAVIWSAAPEQSAAHNVLQALRNYRAQRSVSLL